MIVYEADLGLACRVQIPGKAQCAHFLIYTLEFISFDEVCDMTDKGGGRKIKGTTIEQSFNSQEVKRIATTEASMRETVPQNCVSSGKISLSRTFCLPLKPRWGKIACL